MSEAGCGVITREVLEAPTWELLDSPVIVADCADRDPRQVGEVVKQVLDGDRQIDAQIMRLEWVEREARAVATFAAERLSAIGASKDGEAHG